MKKKVLFTAVLGVLLLILVVSNIYYLKLINNRRIALSDKNWSKKDRLSSLIVSDLTGPNEEKTRLVLKYLLSEGDYSSAELYAKLRGLEAYNLFLESALENGDYEVIDEYQDKTDEDFYSEIKKLRSIYMGDLSQIEKFKPQYTKTGKIIEMILENDYDKYSVETRLGAELKKSIQGKSADELEVAKVLSENKKYALSNYILKRYLENNPSVAYPYLLLSENLINLNKREEAVSELGKGLVENPTDLRLLDRAGEIFEGSKKEEVIARYTYLKGLSQ